MKLLFLFFGLVFSQCYIYNNYWLGISNTSGMFKYRNSVLTVGARFSNIMIWGNAKGFWLANYHDLSTQRSIPVLCLGDEYITTCKFAYTQTLNQTILQMMENTVTDNSNITHTDKSLPKTPGSLCLSSLGLPGKISTTNVWSFTAILLLYLFLFMLAIVYRDRQPMKTKFWSFLICCWGCFWYSVADFIEFQQTFEWYTNNGCFIDAFLLYPSQQITFVLPWVMYMLHMILMNLNFQKIKISDSDNLEESLNWKYKLLYALTSKYIILSFPILYFLVFEFAMFIGTAADGFKCGIPETAANTYIHLVFAAICAGGFLLFLLIDSIISISLMVKCKWKQWWRNDPYYFRVDHISIIFLVICFILWAAGILSKLGDMIVIELAFLFTLLINGGNSLIITIVLDIYHWFRPTEIEENRSELKKMFLLSDDNSKELSKLFREYCQQEYSIENYLCMSDITKLKQSEEKEKIAERIHILYLNPQCAYEVNVSSAVKDEFINLLRTLKNITNDIVINLEGTIMRNLMDTYSRFIFSTEYKQFKNTIKEYELKKSLSQVK